jgi:hypothetical protein
LQVFDAAFNEVTSDAEKIILLILKKAKISEHTALVVTEGADLAVAFIDSAYIIGELPLNDFGGIATGNNDCTEIGEIANDIATLCQISVTDGAAENELAFVVLFGAVL